MRAPSLGGSEVPARRPGPRRRGGQSGVSGSTRLPPALAHGGRAAVESRPRKPLGRRGERPPPPTSAEQRRSLLLTHAGGGGGVGSWRRGEGASARARPRGGEPAGARGGEEGGSRARTHEDGRHPQASGLPWRGWPVRRGGPRVKALRTTPAPVRQCARGGLKRAPTRAGAACESEQAQRGRKAACRLASHRRGQAPARLPRQREARGARQRVALCLGIAAAGSPTSLLRPIHHGLAERRAARLVPRHLGWVNGFATCRKRLVQANACSGRPSRASAMERAAGGPAHHGRSCGRSREGVPPRRNSLAIGALFTREFTVQLGSRLGGCSNHP